MWNFWVQRLWLEKPCYSTRQGCSPQQQTVKDSPLPPRAAHWFVLWDPGEKGALLVMMTLEISHIINVSWLLPLPRVPSEYISLWIYSQIHRHRNIGPQTRGSVCISSYQAKSYWNDILVRCCCLGTLLAGLPMQPKPRRLFWLSAFRERLYSELCVLFAPYKDWSPKKWLSYQSKSYTQLLNCKNITFPNGICLEGLVEECQPSSVVVSSVGPGISSVIN